MAQSKLKLPKVGLLGELEVELRLVQEGWHPVRLDTAQMASNADLIAIDDRHRVSIQVKTTDGNKQKSYSQWLGFGYSTRYLKNGNPIFNSKGSPLIADVIVAVYHRTEGSRFIVMPVAFAENLCRTHCDYWNKVPTKAGSSRSLSFPIYLCFEAQPKAHSDHNKRNRRNLLSFENKWQILFESIDKLHDPEAWPLCQ